MAEYQSLADQAVQALSALNAMEDGMDDDDPARHEVRNLRRIAEQSITYALRTAIELAWQAKSLRKLAREIEEKQVV